MTKRVLFFALIAAMAVGMVFAGCKGREEEAVAPASPALADGMKVVATVGNMPIHQNLLNWQLKSRMMQHESGGFEVTSETLMPVVLDELIVHKVLVMGAMEAGITVSDDEVMHHMAVAREKKGEKFAADLAEAGFTEDQYKEYIRERLMAINFESTLVPKDAVKEKDMREYYKNSPTPFLKPESMLVRMVQAGTEEGAQALKARMDKEGFDKVADSLKGDANYFVSDYSWTYANVFSEQMSGALKGIRVGKYGGPFKIMDGFILLRVKDKAPEGLKTFEEARDEIQKVLEGQVRQMAIHHWVATKKQGLEIARD